jgi:hypothetical protein
MLLLPLMAIRLPERRSIRCSSRDELAMQSMRGWEQGNYACLRKLLIPKVADAILPWLTDSCACWSFLSVANSAPFSLSSVMPSWLLLQSEAGFPLFSRSSGLPGAAFSFATTGLLAAASQAAAAGGFVLSRLGAHDAAVHTASYPGGLVLVLASSDAQSATPEALSARAQRAYDALLFLLGRAKLQDLRHVERTKRHIRSAANLLSLLLVDDAYVLQMGTGFPECCITSSASVVDDLRALAAACNTAHAAIYAQHRMYAWTEQWSVKCDACTFRWHWRIFDLSDSSHLFCCLVPGCLQLSGLNWTRVICSLSLFFSVPAFRRKRVTFQSIWHIRP